MKKIPKCSPINNQHGVSAIIVAICLLMILGFAAFAIDFAHLHLAQNELQNAADAGALAGAGVLYANDGKSINTNANSTASDAAQANYSEGEPVEVKIPLSNSDDVQRGHWSFGLGSLQWPAANNRRDAPGDVVPRLLVASESRVRLGQCF